MSYNITTWKTKKLDNLTIPLSTLYDLSDSLLSRGWRPDDPTIDPVTQTATIELAESEISGKLTADSIAVSEIYIHGEGSGTYFHDIILPALEKSTGELEAALVWAGGDSLQSLKVSNGEISLEDIEL